MAPSVRTLLTQNNGRIRLCETHDRLSTELIRNTVGNEGQRFDGLWIGGLCQTTYLGIPNTELITPLQRAALFTSSGNRQKGKAFHPLCAAFDADSGGDIADIPALVGILAIKGVSMIIIEDKALSEPGKKANSLGGNSGSQDQADMYDFANIIKKFKAASFNKDMMITARIESFTVRAAKKDEAEERGSVQESLTDALTRAEVYRAAGVDAIMIHSKSKYPDEVLSFLTEYRSKDDQTPLVVVPTTYSEALRNTLHEAGANVVIYANHALRAKISAVGTISDKIVAEIPDLFTGDAELSESFEARNFGNLLRKLWEKRYLDEESRDVRMYRIVATTYAAENMKETVKKLLGGEFSGCEADELIIPVKELLKINASHITGVDELT
ncbi:hypothetical protein MBLNU459_g3914t1 [Dothideomycetes sp. NU459]